MYTFNWRTTSDVAGKATSTHTKCCLRNKTKTKPESRLRSNESNTDDTAWLKEKGKKKRTNPQKNCCNEPYTQLLSYSQKKMMNSPIVKQLVISIERKPQFWLVVVVVVVVVGSAVRGHNAHLTNNSFFSIHNPVKTQKESEVSKEPRESLSFTNTK